MCYVVFRIGNMLAVVLMRRKVVNPFDIGRDAQR